VRYPTRSPTYEPRRRAGAAIAQLLADDEFLMLPDLSAWQWLGGRTEGERAWEPLQRNR
jgi:hypothetical protein